ncbi:MAG: hypothetical protein RSG23_08670 [Gordonibacter sp.]|uniref:hypothetical protein n=1 Tax=Gordonibacter sp. TaxID=1968902 RepID=UPI002FC86729
MIDASVLISPVATAICAFAGSYLAFATRLTRVETKVDVLSNHVEKHNEVVERTYKLESDMATCWKRHDELAERVEKQEDKTSGR